MASLFLGLGRLVYEGNEGCPRAPRVPSLTRVSENNKGLRGINKDLRGFRLDLAKIDQKNSSDRQWCDFLDQLCCSADL